MAEFPGTLALEPLKEDVMATKQQVKAQVRPAATQQLLSMFNTAERHQVTPESIPISGRLTTGSILNDSSYLKQMKLGVKKKKKKQQLLDA